MSNILKSKRKESSFQIRNEWLNLRLKLSEYLRADFNDNKISYNGTDTLRYPNIYYYDFDHERKRLLKLIDRIQDLIYDANSIFPTNLEEYCYSSIQMICRCKLTLAYYLNNSQAEIPLSLKCVERTQKRIRPLR